MGARGYMALFPVEPAPSIILPQGLLGDMMMMMMMMIELGTMKIIGTTKALAALYSLLSVSRLVLLPYFLSCTLKYVRCCTSI